MGRYSQLLAATWDDGKFLALTHPARVLFFWTWSHRHASLAGIYRCTLDDMLPVMKGDEGTARGALAELKDARMVLWDEHTEQLWVVNRAKHVAAASPRAAAAVVQAFHRTPAGPLKDAFRGRYGRQLGV